MTPSGPSPWISSPSSSVGVTANESPITSSLWHCTSTAPMICVCDSQVVTTSSLKEDDGTYLCRYRVDYVGSNCSKIVTLLRFFLLVIRCVVRKRVHVVGVRDRINIQSLERIHHLKGSQYKPLSWHRYAKEILSQFHRSHCELTEVPLRTRPIQNQRPCHREPSQEGETEGFVDTDESVVNNGLGTVAASLGSGRRDS